MRDCVAEIPLAHCFWPYLACRQRLPNGVEAIPISSDFSREFFPLKFLL